MSGNFGFAYHNYIQDPGGSWVGDPITGAKGLDNMLDPRLSVGAVFTAGIILAQRRFSTNPVPVKCIAVLNHNVVDPGIGQFRVRLYDDTDTVDPLRYASDDIEAWIPPETLFARHWIIVLPEAINATSVQISVTDGFEGHGFVGGLFASPMIEFNGIESRWGSRTIPLSDTEESKGGQGYGVERDTIRELNVNLSHMPFEMAYGAADYAQMDLQRALYLCGNTRPVILLPRMRKVDGSEVLDPHAIHRIGIYSRLTEVGEILHSGGNQFQLSMRARELL